MLRLCDVFDGLPEAERARMAKQLMAMIMYRDILYDRILNFKTDTAQSAE
jgi:hypothetical protein